MKKAIKKFFNVFMFLFGIGGDIRKNAADDGICDYSGQGKDKYGK